MVLVSRIGVSIRPHSITWVRPETSPAPLRTNPPPVILSEKRFPVSGMIAVTPVRTGPNPGRRGPEPRMMVECPTSTPSTSVIPLNLPGLKRPSGRPSSRARTRGASFWKGSAIAATLPAARGGAKPAKPSGFGFGALLDGGGYPLLDRLDRAAVSSLALLSLLVPPDCSAEDLADQGAVVDPLGLGDQHQVAPPGGESGKRVALEEVEAPALVHSKVHPRHVPASQSHERSAARRFEALELTGVELRGDVVSNPIVPLELVLKAVDRVLLGLVEENYLHRHHHLGPLFAQQAHGEFSAGDVLFHQSGLLVLVDDLPHQFAQLRFGTANAFGNHALGGSLRHRFDHQRETKILEQPLLSGGHQLEVWRVDAVLPNDLLGQALVEGDRQGGGIGAGIRDVEQLQERWDL